MKPPDRPTNVSMGELGVIIEAGSLRTLLGSCLGVALFDRRCKVAGLAHIVLPDSGGRTETLGKYANTAIPELIRKMSVLAKVGNLKLTAKLAGGANMFGNADATSTVGSQNLAAVERILEELGIPVTGRHCGGDQGRRMTLESATGTVTIEVVGASSIII